VADTRSRSSRSQSKSKPKAVKSRRISEQLEADLIQKYERLKEEIIMFAMVIKCSCVTLYGTYRAQLINIFTAVIERK